MRFASAGLVCLSLVSVASLAARQSVLDPKARLTLNLDGKWKAIVDPYDTGYYDYRYQPFDAAAKPTGGFFLDKPTTKTDLQEYNFDTSPTLLVPREWNTQDPKLMLYEGAIWYRRKFDYSTKEGSRVFLHVGAANYESQVYLNGKKVGDHVGGFTPFDVELTGSVKPTGNSLVIRVDNRRHKEGVPTLNTDWWNYGGLTRDVYLFETPQTVLSRYSVRLKPGDPSKIEVLSELDGPQLSQEIDVSIPELHLAVKSQTDAIGHAAVVAEVPADFTRWSPENPKRYEVHIKSATDEVVEKVGFRTIEVKGNQILLNGKPIFLRGACLHEENPLRGGRAYSREDAKLLLGWLKELNGNFLRLAHYPHNENVAEVADEMGILLWEEIPVYWTIQWENPDTLKNARAQLDDLITRDHNRASVIIWSMANETPVLEARTAFIHQLIIDAKALDSTRLVSAALEPHVDPADPRHKILDDPLGAFTDLASFNEYVGWYDGDLDAIPAETWTIKYDKPVFISEFGGDALQGFHGAVTTRNTEEYQAELFRRSLVMLKKIPGLTGMTPWCLVDFRSPKRLLPNVEDGWNRKGLIAETGVKKESFSVVANFYAEMREQAAK